jgi:hypothetical protein
MLYAEFKGQYNKSENWEDAEKLLNRLDEKQLKDFIKSHEQVKFLTGLDMRQEFYLKSAKVIYENKFEKEDN